MWFAFGPLALSEDDLWHLTLGQLLDMEGGYRYREYLQARNDARLACWICNGSGMRSKAMDADDLLGYWESGRVLDKHEYMEHCKRRVLARRKGGDPVGNP